MRKYIAEPLIECSEGTIHVISVKRICADGSHGSIYCFGGKSPVAILLNKEIILAIDDEQIAAADIPAIIRS